MYHLTERLDEVGSIVKLSRQGETVAAKVTLKGLSRMRGNSQVRFFGGKRPVMALPTRHTSSQRQKGRLSAAEMRHARGLFLREIYGEERRRLMVEKTAIRNLTRQTVVDDTQTPARIPNKNERITLQNNLVKLAFVLPRKGKTALAFMPAPVKAETRRIAEWILRRPVFADQTARYLEIAGELAAHHSRQPSHIESAKQNAFDDLRDRVAQVVLKAAAQHRRAELARTASMTAVASVFLQTEDLLSHERRRLEYEGAWLNISARRHREEDSDTEVDNQKEVEKA